MTVFLAEIPGQDQDGYDAEPDFFRGMHGHPQTSRPRPQQRPGLFKKLRLAVTKRSPPPPVPAPTPVPPTALPPAAAPTTFKAHVRHLFTWRPDHAAPPVVDVPFAKGKERNAAADAPGRDEDLVPDEYFDDFPQDPNSTQRPNTQEPNTPQRQQPAATLVDTGEHVGGKSCCCC
ncbi:hypothetical protein DEU56DRAFT_144911 [Suillus clintonianus]|uniref:uncharacterized protein n=1 Tax=Suillus clintonianus TaxID=1904413 RepID=UPI001B86E5BA|nr:uncharacterized protein DEU56DRAFT_144911 [Suillus clintonianus]KAG2118379.1 hypothetical protein DEU56DRAFT_144911 [Suillus clintonianus]